MSKAVLFRTVSLCRWLWLFFLLPVCCTARLDISTTPSEPRIVIYGSVTTENAYHPVSISFSQGFFSEEAARMVSGATVRVESGKEAWIYYESEAGYYLPLNAFAGEPGRQYTLSVELEPDSSGASYLYRASTTVPPPVEIEKIRLRPSTSISDRYEILFWGEVPYDKGYYLNFSVAREGGPFADSLSKYNIVEDRYFGTGYLEGLPCFFLSRESGDKLQYGDVVGMKVDVLPGDYGKFLSDAQSELTGSIPLFSGPPSNMDTNIQLVRGPSGSLPLGFFGSAATARAFAVYEDPSQADPVPLNKR